MQPTNDGTSASEDSIDHADPVLVFSRSGIEATSRMLNSIVETACEHEPDLDLVRLVNYMDLYRVYLEGIPASQTSSDTINEPGFAEQISPITFENFVRSSKLLSSAATMAAVESGDKVATPVPLVISANESSAF